MDFPAKYSFFPLFNFSVSPFPIHEHSYMLTAAFEALAGSEASSPRRHVGRKPQGSGPCMSSAPSPEIVSDLGDVTYCEIPRNAKTWGHLITTFCITWLFSLSSFLEHCTEYIQHGSRTVLNAH